MFEYMFCSYQNLIRNILKKTQQEYSDLIRIIQFYFNLVRKIFHNLLIFSRTEKQKNWGRTKFEDIRDAKTNSKYTQPFVTICISIRKSYQ